MKKLNLKVFSSFLLVFLLGLVLFSGSVRALTECRKPTSYTDPDADAVNPANAYDGDCGDESTYADEVISQNPGDEIVFHTWQTTIYTYDSLTLYVKYASSGFSDDLWCIQYSTDGGSTWNDLVPCSSNNYASVQTASVSLSPSQDLSQLQVKVYGDKEKGPDNGHVYIYDVYTLGTYTDNPPYYTNDGDDSGGSVYEGSAVKAYALWHDDHALNTAILRTNRTGAWANESYISLSGTLAWSNFTIDTTGFTGTLCWNIWANDSSNNWNTSMQMHCFNVQPIERWLEISWKSGSDINSQTCTESSPCNLPYYSIKTLNLTVTCHTNPPGLSCGEIKYSFLYNKSSTPDTLINETPDLPFHFPTYIYFWEEFDDQQKFIENWNNYTNIGNDGSATLRLETHEGYDRVYTVMYQGVHGDSDLLYDPEAFVSVWTKKWFDINKTYRIYIHILTSARSTATGNEYDDHDFQICPTPTSINTQRGGSCYSGVAILSWGYNAYNGVCRTDGCFLTGRIYGDVYENRTYNMTYTYFIDGSELRRDINITRALVNGSYTLLMRTSILTATGGGQNSWLNTRIDYIGVEYYQPNPFSCGELSDGDSCNIDYWMNVSGNVGEGYSIKFNVSSSIGLTNESYAYVKISQPLTGNLIVSLDSPDPSTYTSSNPLPVQPNDTFWINATVTCSGGLCFDVYGTPRYNSSGTEPDTSIGTEKTDTPFSILRPYGKIKWKIESDISSGADSVYGIAVDSNNNVILVGYDSSPGNEEWRIEKRDSNRNLIWVKQFDFSTGDDEAVDVVVDSNDNIIVCGFDNVNGNPQWRVIKLDSNGNWLWNYTWNPSSGDDSAMACDVDSNDNILVGGWDYSPGDDQWAVKKLDSNGNEIDSWTYNPTSGSDRLFSLAVDRVDNSIYVGGDHYVSGNDWNFAIRKLNSSLDLQWEYVRDYAPNYDESCFGLAVDNNRNVVGAGGTHGCPTHDCDWKFRIVKLKPDGTELWNVSFNYAEWWDRAHCVAVNSRNEIFAAGVDERIGYLQNEWRIIQLDPNGNKLAEFTFNENDVDWLLGCAIDKNDDLIVGGYFNSNQYKWAAIKIGKLDRNPCSFMDDGDTCKLSWIINVTGTSGTWAIDTYFNSSSEYVQSNDTDNSYIQITVAVYDASFSIALPSTYTEVPITGTTEAGATTLDWISFNFTDVPQYYVEPYVMGDPSNAQNGALQPIFLIKNTGNINIRIEIRFSSLPPTGLELYANSTCATGDCTPITNLVQITDTYQTVLDDLGVGKYGNITLYANALSSAPAYESSSDLYIRSVAIT